jgi:flagellar protein FliS
LRRAAEEADPSTAGPFVAHAASVVAELLGSLDLTAGGPAGNLANIYGYLLNELTAARCTSDHDRLAELRPIVDSLREAFATAAATVASAASTSASAASAAIAVAGASPQPAPAWVG